MNDELVYTTDVARITAIGKSHDKPPFCGSSSHASRLEPTLSKSPIAAATATAIAASNESIDTTTTPH